MNTDTIPTESCIFAPSWSAPNVSGCNTSPTWYPLPPLRIVAAIATPLLTVMLAVAFWPVPVSEVRPIPENVNWPDDGVYPLPTLVRMRLPVPIPANLTNVPDASVLTCVTLLPTDNG